jgi:asparagine synthase (glutamine-hydrolysing)
MDNIGDMDNLFAVITSNQSSSDSSTLINNQLFKQLYKITVNRENSAAIEISAKNHNIHLVNYSSHLKLVDNCSQLFNQKFTLTSPIIGNNRIDNKNDVMASCNFSGFSKDVNDDEVLLTAYSKWGVESFSKLKGNFHTIFWDEQSQQLYAAIDAFSGRSLFYVTLGGALYIASDAQTLATLTEMQLTVNKLAVSQWLAGRPNPDLSMFNEIKRLPAGHCLEYSKENGIKITKFWDIDPGFSVNYSNTEDYKAHFFELLQSSVAKRLAVPQFSESTAVFCQMSGGMDSTSVTAIAKQLLDEQNLPLHTLSHRYQNTKTCDESTNIKDMISKLGLAHQHYIELDQFESSSFAQLYPTDFDNPGVVLSPKYHQELALMKRLGASVLLTGNGGDETCWGHSASYRSRLYKGEIGVINEVIDACSQLNEPVARSLYKLFMPSSVQNMIKLARKKPINTNECPPWLLPQAFDLVMDDNRLFINPFSATFDPARHARYHGLKSTSTYNSMRSYQKVASGYGIDVRHPFFDTELVEFSFAIPEKLLIQGVYPKWLLRHTMKEHLPHSVCWNKHKVVFDHHFANLVRNNQVELRKLLSNEGLQELGLVDNRILLREFDAVVNNPNGHLNVDMLYAILTQLWFQTHCLQ